MDKRIKERYKYTDIAALTARALGIGVIGRGHVMVESQAQQCLVDESLLALEAGMLPELMEDPVVAQNLGAGGELVGFGMTVPRREIVSGVVDVDYRVDGGVSGLAIVRNVLEVEADSRVRVVVTYHSVGVVQAGNTENAENGVVGDVVINALTVIRVARGATVELVEIAATGGVLMSNIVIEQQLGSEVTATTIDVNNKVLVRNQYVRLQGEGARCSLSGLYLTSGEQTCDNYIKVAHLVPNCESVQSYKGVMAGRSVAAFTGSIYVAQDAQKTAAYQQNHNIVLNDAAKIYTRPQLEIYADDVKCNHGATVGRLDEQAIFYMRQRGISYSAARRLQIEGFAWDVIRLSDMGELQDIMRDKITKRLGAL